MKKKYNRSSPVSPGKVILENAHEDDDDEAQQQHHQNQRVDDGEPVDLQSFREEWVIPKALRSPGIRQVGFVPVHAVGVGNRQGAPAHSDPTHSSTRALL